ncbi:MAG: dioxygenase [Anaeromyxobacter sp.]
MTRDEHDHAGEGLARDLSVLRRLQGRRAFLRALGTASMIPLVGCGPGGAGGAAASDTSGDTSGGAGGTSCQEIPTETGGPYPADGTNGPNALSLDGIVRRDITSSFGSMTGTAEGIPLTVKLTLANAAASCAALAGYAIYLWHCDQGGYYSLYTAPARNYLRGLQEAGADGVVTFQTIFPGCYSGRWPHIHFEVYTDLSSAVAGTGKVKTSQLALPAAVCAEVYGTSGYASSKTNLAGVSLATDNVFSDGYDLELASVDGDTGAGFVASLVVGV